MRKYWLLASASLLCPGTAFAQTGTDPAPQGSTSALADEIIVTATKKGYGENVQDVPIAVTAYGEAQLDAKFVQNLQSLSYDVPNVQLEDVGSTPGYANFSIRGLGINSSIPSIDPTVGVFIDGVYLGINAGVVFDNFDLEGLEVLRGPQGLLFGRNVTGGAVVVRTSRPSFDLEFRGK
ncbi:TonB-dependent receptor plug domain-containing protein, partial [Agrobacterium sp.]